MRRGLSLRSEVSSCPCGCYKIQPNTNIRVEQFNMASEDKSCTHILFAACHDSAYLSQLVPLSGIRDKVTLVQGAGWNSEFQYNLNVTQFPTVFRWSELPTSVLSTKAAPTNGSVTPKPNAAPKKSVPNVPTGPRQNDPRANNVISSNSAVMESDGVPIGTNGFNTSNSVNPKTSGAHKSSQQPCKYFQKVESYSGTIFLHANQVRDIVVSVMIVPSNTSLPRRSIQTNNHHALEQIGLVSPLSFPPAQHQVTSPSISIINVSTTIFAHPAKRSGLSITRASTSKSRVTTSISNAFVPHTAVPTTITILSRKPDMCLNMC
jgi:hypothetical protein